MLVGIVKKNAIMMTTMAVLMGTLPIALATEQDADSRRPLGLAGVGGLLVAQLLTFYITPVIYLYMEKARGWLARHRQGPVKIVSTEEPVGSPAACGIAGRPGRPPVARHRYRSIQSRNVGLPDGAHEPEHCATERAHRRGSAGEDSRS
jgi:AcrB/AcrD/AcrF family